MSTTLPPAIWITADFQASSLFSLRPATTTSAGGRTLPLPTPYAVKMALLDAAFHSGGPAAGSAVFPLVHKAAVAFLPSERVTVTNTFQRVLKIARADAGDDSAADDAGASGPLANTLAYREVAFLHGPFRIALGLHDPKATDRLRDLFWCINYFGRRGGFVQVLEVATTETFDLRWTVVDPLGWQPDETPDGDLAVPLDDFGDGATLAAVDPFSGKPAKIPRDRVIHYRILPLRRGRASRTFREYRLLGSGS